jgi:hypothetical protein
LTEKVALPRIRVTLDILKQPFLCPQSPTAGKFWTDHQRIRSIDFAGIWNDELKTPFRAESKSWGRQSRSDRSTHAHKNRVLAQKSSDANPSYFVRD